jgi:hypothetical protein
MADIPACSFKSPFVPTRDSCSIKIERHDISKNTLQDISATSSKTIFIEYDFWGHVYPNEDKIPVAQRLQIQIVDWFFIENIKN